MGLFGSEITFQAVLDERCGLKQSLQAAWCLCSLPILPWLTFLVSWKMRSKHRASSFAVLSISRSYAGHYMFNDPQIIWSVQVLAWICSSLLVLPWFQQWMLYINHDQSLNMFLRRNCIGLYRQLWPIHIHHHRENTTNIKNTYNKTHTHTKLAMQGCSAMDRFRTSPTPKKSN